MGRTIRNAAQNVKLIVTVQSIQNMKIIFEHAGIQRTLAKHPAIQQKIKSGAITVEAAAEYPWYLRLEEQGKAVKLKLRALKESDAIREAIDLLKARIQRPNDFTAFLDARAAARTVTVGNLVQQWFEAGLPFSATRARPVAAANFLRVRLTRALPFWQDVAVATVKPSTHADFVVWRRQNVKRKGRPGAGSRTADIELAALSCMCQWAVKTGKLTINPFEKRECFTDPDAVNHCHDAMAANDDELHRVLGHFWQPGSEPNRIVAGAWLAFTALSGLRPGEHTRLHRYPLAAAYPASLAACPFGIIFPMPDGTLRMKVDRLKRGQNPVITIHAALADFLDSYVPWVTEQFPEDLRLFPLADIDSQLNAYLRRACVAVGVAKMKPHGFGRAYYVRVRRSQGIDDSTIAAELGQKSDGDLIRSVYGDPMDPVGGNLHDWIPTQGNPAWQLISNRADQTNIIPLAKIK